MEQFPQNKEMNKRRVLSKGGGVHCTVVVSGRGGTENERANKECVFTAMSSSVLQPLPIDFGRYVLLYSRAPRVRSSGQVN